MRKVARPEVALDKPSAPKQLTMKLLTDRTREVPKRGPGPSKLAYRLSRVWKKLWVRRITLVVLPLGIATLLVWQLAVHPSVRAVMADQKDAIMAALSTRPEFAVTGMAISGASAPLGGKVRFAAGLPEGASSLTLDLAAVQARIAALPAVRKARVTLTDDGTLNIAVIERHPQALWRDEEDTLWLVDREGVALEEVTDRALYPTLPLVIGAEAPKAMTEALDVFNAVPDIHGRLRALVRVGARRWDVVLDRGLTIMLPAEAPDDALSRVMAWHYGEELLDRGLAVIDMRLADRPTIRMTEEAAESYRLFEAAQAAGEEET